MREFVMRLFTIIGMLSQGLSAFIFGSTWLLSDITINKIGGTYWDYNPILINFLKTARRETCMGLFFLIVGLILILIPEIDDLWAQKGYRRGD